ncbi:MAG: helix-turn-helix domain-containing protein [Cellvibrionaceae bacterium]|nr:helix-turn-helix domain-containing protein [Cellvibrionaceae bacterium]
MPDAVDDSPGCRLHHLSDIPINSNETDYIEIFRALFLIIDSHQWDSAVLAAIRMDELIYRQVVLLLHSYNLPDKTIQHQGHSFKYQLIDELCNKLLARLHLPIALADIENLSGISARGLQYAFQERFGCSPMVWVREHRLQAARDRLLRGQCSVMEVAVSCGFGSSSLFTRYYQARFGETPSGTLKKHSQL